MKTGLLLTLAMMASTVHAQTPARQTQEDDYTKYELLSPESAQFRIYYEVTATTPGARFFFNTIRPGSVATDERVLDLSTGQPLKWEVVSGKDARSSGHPTADLETEYIKVHLARPVPQGGESRLLIDKTYKDPKSYYRDGETIVFDRSLGIRRNAIVLPRGYRLVSCNVSSQVMALPDGRIQVSFMNASAAAAPLVIRAKPGLSPFTPNLPTTRGSQVSTTLASQATRLSDRAYQDREIVYYLNDPKTGSFSLYHDYTESRSGVKHYFNVVRAGSRVSSPSAKILDTGENLEVETISGADTQKRGLDPGEPVQADTELWSSRSRRCRKGSRSGCASPKPTPMRGVITSTVKNWSGIVRLVARATRWSCPRAGRSWPARFLPRFRKTPAAVNGCISRTRDRTKSKF
jgi:hypothetical protein